LIGRLFFSFLLSLFLIKSSGRMRSWSSWRRRCFSAEQHLPQEDLATWLLSSRWI